MTEGTIKTSKYEIIAIFREELRKRTEIEIFFNNTSIITQLTRVDFAEFHIQTHRKIPSGHKIRFLLHSDSGKIEFNAALTKHDKEGANKQVISSQADSLIKISRIWADFFPANTSNQPI